MTIRCWLATVLSVWVFASPGPAVAQDARDAGLTKGLKQLDAARSGGSAQAYEEAEALFEQVLRQNPNHARALVHRGEARIMRGVAGLQTGLDASLQLFQTGIADMDRAVVMAPDDLDVRVTRGLTYAAFPSYYDKSAVARGDLEAARRHSQFPRLPQALRERIAAMLERGGINDGFVPEEARKK